MIYVLNLIAADTSGKESLFHDMGRCHPKPPRGAEEPWPRSADAPITAWVNYSVARSKSEPMTEFEKESIICVFKVVDL